MSTWQIHVFISHSWQYSEHYDTLAEWIFSRSWRSGQASITMCDFSVPKTDPIVGAGTDAELQAAIYAQIARSHVVVIPTGMYANYSKWIGKEIRGAAHHSKPILAVNPWGQIRASSVVANAAQRVVGWNASSVAQGIVELYRS
jgi:hypothetical protein